MIGERVFISNTERKAIQRRQYHQEHHRFGKPSSSTTGRSKNIHPSPIQKGVCRCARSYKWRNYADLMESLGKREAKK